MKCKYCGQTTPHFATQKCHKSQKTPEGKKRVISPEAIYCVGGRKSPQAINFDFKWFCVWGGKGCEWYMVGDDGLVGEKRKTLPRPGKIDTKKRDLYIRS